MDHYPSGSKSFRLRIVVNGKRRDYGLGGHPDVSLEDARDDALEYRRMARKGIDPVEAAKRKTPSFERAAIRFARDYGDRN